MSDYRDPKVTTPKSGASNTSTWIGIALAVLVVLLLVWWLWPGGEAERAGAPPATEQGAAPPAEEPGAPPATTEEPAPPPATEGGTAN